MCDTVSGFVKADDEEETQYAGAQMLMVYLAVFPPGSYPELPLRNLIEVIILGHSKRKGFLILQ